MHRMMRLAGVQSSLVRIMSARHMNRMSAGMWYLDWQRRRLLRQFPVERTISRSRICAADRDSGVAALVYTQGMYDYNNMLFLQELLRWKPGVFFDIGANIGPYTLIASEVTDAEVWAFEPHPRTFGELAANVARNGRRNVETFQIALSDRDSILALTDGRSSATNHLVPAGGSGSIRVEEGGRTPWYTSGARAHRSM